RGDQDRRHRRQRVHRQREDDDKDSDHSIQRCWIRSPSSRIFLAINPSAVVKRRSSRRTSTTAPGAGENVLAVMALPSGLLSLRAPRAGITSLNSTDSVGEQTPPFA
ncbi:unnamed protein product, partial [Scytosiphon promiscuus]